MIYRSQRVEGRKGVVGRKVRGWWYMAGGGRWPIPQVGQMKGS